MPCRCPNSRPARPRARCDAEVQVAEHGTFAAVGEIDVFETDFPARDLQRRRIGTIDDFVRPYDHRHAVVDVADVFEEIEEAATQAAGLFDQ